MYLFELCLMLGDWFASLVKDQETCARCTLVYAADVFITVFCHLALC